MARKVSIKSAADIEMARKAGALAAQVLHMIAEHVRPGVTTDELDRICHDYIVNAQKAIPANVGRRMSGAMIRSRLAPATYTPSRQE
mgnify:CR=1 FL=1